MGWTWKGEITSNVLQDGRVTVFWQLIVYFKIGRREDLEYSWYEQVINVGNNGYANCPYHTILYKYMQLLH
jgi:hypothetical protein